MPTIQRPSRPAESTSPEGNPERSERVDDDGAGWHEGQRERAKPLSKSPEQHRRAATPLGDSVSRAPPYRAEVHAAPLPPVAPRSPTPRPVPLSRIGCADSHAHTRRRPDATRTPLALTEDRCGGEPQRGWNPAATVAGSSDGAARGNHPTDAAARGPAAGGPSPCTPREPPSPGRPVPRLGMSPPLVRTSLGSVRDRHAVVGASAGLSARVQGSPRSRRLATRPRDHGRARDPAPRPQTPAPRAWGALRALCYLLRSGGLGFPVLSLAGRLKIVF
jgi:hypothetical protein